MWQNLKKRVTNFIYEDYEEEQVEAVNVTDERKQDRPNLNQKERLQKNVPIDTKMAYQYPQKKATPFRFPLIPDENTQDLTKAKPNEEKRNEPVINENTKQTINNKIKNEHVQREHRQRQLRRASLTSSKQSLLQNYQTKSAFKELENIPAYMRRRQGENPQKRPNRQVDVSVKNQEKLENEEPIKYSQPDELDRFFKDLRQRQANIEIEKTEKKSQGTEVNLLKDTEEEPSQINKAEAKFLAEASPVDEINDSVTSEKGKEVEDLIQSTPTKLGVDKLSPQSTKSLSEFVIKDEPNPRGSVTSEVGEIIDGEDSNIDGITPTLEYDFSDKQINMSTDNERIKTANDQKIRREITYKAVPNYLLDDPSEPEHDDAEWLDQQQYLLAKTLKHFNIDAKIVKVTQGPSVTRIEIQPALGVKVSKIRNLADDIKLNMSAQDIRIEAPIPGKNTVGIEIPNKFPQTVHLQELIETSEFKHAESPLTIALGMSIEGEPLMTNVNKMPHGLIAGATGSGKSVCINTIILSLLYKAHYEDVKLLLIDPKMVELTPYNGIPHLISPVITDVKAATMALKWAVAEMEERYEKFVQQGVRNIEKYNEKVSSKKEEMPYVVIVIDELADLMMVAPQDVEDAICRIAQKARAAGIHLIIATQRPSVDVITGLIKANIPTRIAFSVSSQVDSRTIVDTTGAEKLLGKGDMLFIENGANKSVRLQGPFVSDEEIDRIANYLRQVAEPNYLFEQEQLLIEVEQEDEDEILEEVIDFVISQNQASTSLLQRRFRIGYNRAARLIDTLENKGVISAQNGSKPRDVLISKTSVKELD